MFRTFKFEDEADKSKIDKITDAFKKYCIGEVNVTYERYVFHQRVQHADELMDDFFADLRVKAKSCEFGDLEDSLIRDRIVIGIRDDPTRRRLLQMKKLSLAEAVDACKASEDVAASSRHRRHRRHHRSRIAGVSRHRRQRRTDKRIAVTARRTAAAVNVVTVAHRRAEGLKKHVLHTARNVGNVQNSIIFGNAANPPEPEMETASVAKSLKSTVTTKN